MAKNQSKIKLSVIIPVLNEKENLKILLKILESVINLRHEVRHEVLVVHDFKEDNSIPVVRKMQKNHSNLRLVHNALGRGVINAVKAGVKSSNGEYILVIAADDIGSLLAINDMAFLMENGCDLVNGTRYSHGGKHIGGVFISSLLSSTANGLFYLFSSSSLTDPTLGVKMFKKLKFDELNLEAKPIGWAVSFEFAIKAQIAGWKLGEVPLISLNRIYGKNKSTFKLKWLAEYLKWFLFGIKNLPLYRRKSRIMVKIPEIMKSSNES